VNDAGVRAERAEAVEVFERYVGKKCRGDIPEREGKWPTDLVDQKALGSLIRRT
jgi:hypothetical protein